MKQNKMNNLLMLVIRILIILIPYLFHYFRLIVQLIDELLQQGAHTVLKYLGLLNKTETKQVIL